MAILNNGEKLFYLKSVNVIGEQNIFLFFRQEAKYILKPNIENLYDYINICLILCMENPTDANNQCLKIKEYFLDDAISIDYVSETEIEFIGRYDYRIKVKKYDENIIDQFKEDWIDRYLYATKLYCDQRAIGENYHNLLKEIVTISKFSKNEIAIKIMDKISSFEDQNQTKIE